jgi:hypothetical protein
VDSALQNALGSYYFPRVQLDLSAANWAKTIDNAFGETLNPPFNPYDNSLNYLISIYTIPYVGLTGYVGTIPLLQGVGAKAVSPVPTYAPSSTNYSPLSFFIQQLFPSKNFLPLFHPETSYHFFILKYLPFFIQNLPSTTFSSKNYLSFFHQNLPSTTFSSKNYLPFIPQNWYLMPTTYLPQNRPCFQTWGTGTSNPGRFCRYLPLSPSCPLGYLKSGLLGQGDFRYISKVACTGTWG